MAEAKAKTVNYTEEMVDLMLRKYEEMGNDGLPEIAEMLGKSVRSIRSKLVREGVYVAAPTTPRAKREEGPTKKELLRELEALAPFPVDGFMGATKQAISNVIAHLKHEQDEAIAVESEVA